MRKGELYYLYFLIRWILLMGLGLTSILLFVIEEPSTVLGLLSKPLQEEGIKYESMEGGLFSGFTLKGFNFQDKLKAEKVQLKLDLDRLEERILYIENIELEQVHIDREFLKSLTDTNSSSEETNSPLPFDKIVVKGGIVSLNDFTYNNISLKSINLQVKDLNMKMQEQLTLHNSNILIEGFEYGEYGVKSANLKLSDFTTDLKARYRGDIKLKVDSNVSNIDIEGSVKDKFVKLRGEVEPKQPFLERFLADKNITLKSSPKFTLEGSGNPQRVEYNIVTERLGLTYQNYKIDSKKLNLKGSYNIDEKYLNLNLDTLLNGNMGRVALWGATKVDFDDINQTLEFKLNSKLAPNRKFLTPYLNGVKLNLNPKLQFSADGDLKNLKYKLKADSLDITKDEYRVKSKKLVADGEYSVLKKSLKLNLNTILDSNVAHLKLKGGTALNLNDVNGTLKYNLTSTLKPKLQFVQSQLPKDILISKISPIDVSLKGNLKRTKFKVNLQDLRGKREDIALRVSPLHLQGNIKPLQGDTALKLKTKFDSTAGGGSIGESAKLNFKDLNTLQHQTKLLLYPKPKFVNKFLKDSNISIVGSPKANISLKGGIKRFSVQANLNTKLLQADEVSTLKLQSSPIAVDLNRSLISGGLTLQSASKNMKFALDTKFNGDYTNPKELKGDSKLSIEKFNNFGVNLNPLTPFKLRIKNSKAGAFIKIDSKRIWIDASTRDYDKFKFNIKTRNIYLYKIIELPEELHHKFVRLNLKGNAEVSKKWFRVDGEIDSNKGFKAKLDAKNGRSGLSLNLSSSHLKLTAKGDLDKKDIEADMEINSIRGFQQEISKLYPLEIANVDGRLSNKLSLKGERIGFKISSPKLELSGFNIENIDIEADYNKKLVTIQKFNLRTTGFSDRKLNRDIHLNREGKIYLGEDKRYVDIDIYPNIKIRADGDSDTLDGKVTISKLPLGHPEYGSVLLSTNVDYSQQGEFKTIQGDIYLKYLQLFYEPKFLDIHHDPDVVEVTKRDKRMKQGLKDDTFLKNTFIDLNIRARQANYRTIDIDLSFDINLNVRKDFGKPTILIGRIEDIEGRFDQSPKRFYIRNSNVIFSGEQEINPLLDIKVEYELPQVMIYINIGGYAKRPKLEFTSEPPMPKKDIMSYLLLGVSTAKLTEGEGSLGREAELFILNQAARDFAYDFGLDRIFIKDDGTGEGYIVEAGKKVTKRDMVIIESSPKGNSYIIEHDFSKNIKLRVGQHQKEHPSQSIDLYFRKRFK